MGTALVWAVLALAALPVGVDGGLPRGQVEDVVRWHARDVNACFSGAARNARLRYRFEITEGGRVGGVAFIDSHELEPQRATCVATALERWPFPSSDAGTLVDWTFAATAADAGIVAVAVTLDPERLPDRWSNDLFWCWCESPSLSAQGRLSLELLVAPAGSVVEDVITAIDPALEVPGVVNCIKTAALHWSLSPAPTWRRARTDWVLAADAERSRALVEPARPARAVSHLPSPPEPSDGGGLDRELIGAEISRATPSIKGCYERRLAERNELRGVVMVHFVIGAAGLVVKQRAIRDTVGDEPTTRCILGVVSGLKFPPPAGDGVVDVTFPWVFMTAEADAGVP